MGNSLEIHGGLLARNTALNFAGTAVPLLVGLATIPFVVRRLGSDGFGVLSIAWVLLGYFSLFDLGLGRATTKYVAECLGRGEVHRLPGLVWTSLALQLVLGVLGSLLVVAFTPVLVDRALKVPPSLVHDTKVSFVLLAVSLPVVLATTALRGVLESAQRFDLVNYIKVPANISVFLLPAIALVFGLGLPGIVFLLVLARLGATLAYLAVCVRVFPMLRDRYSFDGPLIRPLARYGGWITVAAIVNPLLVNIDRFLIGALLSMAAVGYYTVPMEIVTKFWIVPASLAATLFPAFSTLGTAGTRDKLEKIYWRSLKYLLIIMGPVALLVVIFAKDILRTWLGAEFASRSSLAMQVLAFGVLLNSLAYVPYHLLQGRGRPDVVARVLVFELPFYVGLAWLMITRFGIAGAAAAWSFRAGVEALLLLWVARRLLLSSPQVLAESGLFRGIAAPFVLAATLLPLIGVFGSSVLLRLLISTIFVAAFAWVVWFYVLDETDRRPVLAAIGPFLAIVGGSRES